MSSEEFDTALGGDRGATEPAMIVDVEGFEGLRHGCRAGCESIATQEA